jgi:hypothetical protein
MEPVGEDARPLEFKHPTRQEPLPYIPDNNALVPLEDDVENQLSRSRAGTLSSEESLFEGQMNELINIFSDVSKIEDEQYVESVLEVLSRDRKETYHSITPYLSRRLRDSYNEVRELTEARKRSSLKKLMKQLIADSINDAFIRAHDKREQESKEAARDSRKSKIILAGVIVTGVVSTLTAFLAAYFGHAC